MAVGKRVYVALSYMRTPGGAVAPGDRFAEDDPRFVKELAHYYEKAGVAPIKPPPKGKQG